MTHDRTRSTQPGLDAEPVLGRHADDGERRAPVDESEVALDRALPFELRQQRREDRDQHEEDEDPEAGHGDAVLAQPLQSDPGRRLTRSDDRTARAGRDDSDRGLRQCFGTRDDRFHVRYLLPWAHKTAPMPLAAANGA
jgi:hypothetical protein